MTMIVMRPSKWAYLSPDRVYRYTLTRRWGPEAPYALFVLLNPSTADEESNDNTTKKCMALAKSWGYDCCVLVNLFAIRTRYPKIMRQARDPVGPGNDKWILDTAKLADRVVCGWGQHGKHRLRGYQVRKMLVDAGVDLYALRVSQGGEPWHPLFLAGNTQPFLWHKGACA